MDSEQRNLEKRCVAIGLGSNLGDRFFNIELALRLLENPSQVLNEECASNPSITVVDTSFLYETSPMYVTDQPSFVNCACIVETDVPPVPLLRILKQVEVTVGRIPSLRYGPRAVDLDILFYGDTEIDTRPAGESNMQGHLVVPHPAILEREFVLRPLNDMIPDHTHPVYQKSIHELLRDLSGKDPSLCRVLPFPRYPLLADHPWPFPAVPVVPRTLTHWTYPVVGEPPRAGVKRKTHIMATLNATPDSFSDGATHDTLETGLKYARESVEGGASIIDIGGYSTRPGATFVSTEDEVNRVIPLVQAIRGGNPSLAATGMTSRLREIPISIDTFRAEVARVSILAGANCINDVYAFTGPHSFPCADDAVKNAAEICMASMKHIAREYAVPTILMHSRGEAAEHKDYSKYMNGASGSVICGVQVELGDKVERIIKGKGGVRRWMVIVDPGIGFSKTVEGNLELLRDASKIVADIKIVNDGVYQRNPLTGYPLLIGPSRKSFLGAILSQGERGRDTIPKERTWATATAVACAVQQGAMTVRVHDVEEMADVVSVAEHLWE